jgi:L-serine dehydratase
MNLSVFDLFKIGIGPSSSHTVGPMKAANAFAKGLVNLSALGNGQVSRVTIDLYGSLALTGRGHRTDVAIVAGLSGCAPDSVAPLKLDLLLGRVRTECEILLGGELPVPFQVDTDYREHEAETLPYHSNGMRFTALNEAGNELYSEVWYSVGGGFVVKEPIDASSDPSVRVSIPFPFQSARELLRLAKDHQLTLAEVISQNEDAIRPRAETISGLLRIWNVMWSSIERGCEAGGVLPGGLKVERRAAIHFAKLSKMPANEVTGMDWCSVYALAVNEENAAGGRVVTAPTNGAAGVIPAVLGYALKYLPIVDRDATICQFLLTSAAIGMLYKRNASLSAAEMGCQGEVGVACSMAAAGLAALLGGTNEQIEEAAEIGMEHHLGLTCDPIAGLVQIPCIERNTMGAIKAVNAARMAVVYGDGRHHVSLDQVIETMRQTGVDMQVKYKETSLGGLAVNVVEC